MIIIIKRQDYFPLKFVVRVFLSCLITSQDLDPFNVKVKVMFCPLPVQVKQK